MNDVSSRWPIDRERVLVTGFSSGGSMAWLVACYMGEEFAAYVPVAGALRRPVPSQTCPGGPVAMLHFSRFRRHHRAAGGAWHSRMASGRHLRIPVDPEGHQPVPQQSERNLHPASPIAAGPGASAAAVAMSSSACIRAVTCCQGLGRPGACLVRGHCRQILTGCPFASVWRQPLLRRQAQRQGHGGRALEIRGHARHTVRLGFFRPTMANAAQSHFTAADFFLQNGIWFCLNTTAHGSGRCASLRAQRLPGLRTTRYLPAFGIAQFRSLQGGSARAR